jgi:hypothetical protein
VTRATIHVCASPTQTLCVLLVPIDDPRTPRLEESVGSVMVEEGGELCVPQSSEASECSCRDTGGHEVMADAGGTSAVPSSQALDAER